MAIFNDTNSIMLGDKPVERVYMGNNVVWDDPRGYWIDVLTGKKEIMKIGRDYTLSVYNGMSLFSGISVYKYWKNPPVTEHTYGDGVEIKIPHGVELFTSIAFFGRPWKLTTIILPSTLKQIDGLGLTTPYSLKTIRIYKRDSVRMRTLLSGYPELNNCEIVEI